MPPQPRALIIDDNPFDREVARSALGADGWIVDEASTGVEGVARAAQVRYDAILLDFRMPDLDGLEVLRRVREAGIEAPVVALTSFGSEDVATRFLSEGAVDFVPKDKLFEMRLRQVVKGLRDAAAQGLARPRVTTTRRPVRVLLVSRALWLGRLVHEAFDTTNEAPVVDMAASLIESDEMARTRPHDVILIDADLPAGGLEALATVRHRAGRTPAIALTRADNERAALSYLAAGARDFLDKDHLSPLRLRLTVHTVLGWSTPAAT